VPLETGGKDELYKTRLTEKKHFSQGQIKEIESVGYVQSIYSTLI